MDDLHLVCCAWQDGVALTVDRVLVLLGRREPRHGGSFEWSGL
jgi:hypothetical protein